MKKITIRMETVSDAFTSRTLFTHITHMSSEHWAYPFKVFAWTSTFFLVSFNVRQHLNMWYKEKKKTFRVLFFCQGDKWLCHVRMWLSFCLCSWHRFQTITWTFYYISCNFFSNSEILNKKRTNQRCIGDVWTGTVYVHSYDHSTLFFQSIF